MDLLYSDESYQLIGTGAKLGLIFNFGATSFQHKRLVLSAKSVKSVDNNLSADSADHADFTNPYNP